MGRYWFFFSSTMLSNISRFLRVSFTHDCFRADNHRYMYPSASIATTGICTPLQASQPQVYVPLCKHHNKSPAFRWETHTFQSHLHRGHWQIRLRSVSVLLFVWRLINLWSNSQLTTEVVRFCFSLPKAEKTGLILFPWNFWLNSQFLFLFLFLFCNCDNFKRFSISLLNKKGIVIFDIIVLSPQGYLPEAIFINVSHYAWTQLFSNSVPYLYFYENIL